MVGTVIAFILALLLYFSDIGRAALPNIALLGIILITVATIFLVLPILIQAIAWKPLQNAENSLTPRISELFRKDVHIKAVHIILLIFPLLSYIFAIDLLFLEVISRNIILPIWILLLGISIDAIYYLLKRTSAYLDPFHVIDLLAHDANADTQASNELGVCNNIDAQSEIAVHAIQRTSISLCNKVIDSLQKTARVFFESYKSISHPIQADQDIKAGLSDTVSYTLFFLLQRIEMINDKAVEKKLEPVCSNIVTSTGKIVLSSARYDISMASYPLHYLGKFALKSMSSGIHEVGPKAVSTLVAVARTIITEIDTTYGDLQTPFLNLISQLHEVTKEMFRQDKSINLKILTQPFLDLKELFKNEKVASHQDTPVIVQDIDRVLAEYSALAEVMKSMPPIPPEVLET